MNSGKKLIDCSDYYEIKDYEPIVNRDENGNVVSIINCPYIPKFLVDGADQVSIGQQVTAWTTRDRDSLKVKKP
jgi:hypothetical protein